MSPLYVIGPVLSSPEDWVRRTQAIMKRVRNWHKWYPWLTERQLLREFKDLHRVYSTIAGVAKESGINIYLPISDPSLEEASPQSFSSVIYKRIMECDKVVALYNPLDASGPIETAFAASEGKQILVLARDPELVPRLMRGLPGIRGIVRIDDNVLPSELWGFVREG